MIKMESGQDQERKKGSKQFDPVKLIFHADRVIELLAEGDVRSPITLDLDPTNICNHGCLWCSFDYLHDSADFLRKEVFERLISDISIFRRQNGYAVKSIIFTGGGEPTLHNDLDEFMRQCFDNSIRCGLYTNGTNISQGLESAIIDSCDWVRFSLEASNKEIYDLLHRPKQIDSFDKVTKAIGSMVKKKSAKGHGPTIGISFLVHPYNHRDIVRSVRRAKDMGVDYFQVKPVIRRACENQDVSVSMLEELEGVYAEVRGFAGNGFDVIIHQEKLDDIVDPGFGREYSRCLGHYFSSTICADGSVYICTEFRGIRRYRIGNLNDSGFYDIWGSKARQEVIASIDLNECQPGCKGHLRTRAVEQIKQIKHREFI